MSDPARPDGEAPDRADRVRIGPNELIVLLVVAIIGGIVIALLGPQGDGLGPTLVRTAGIGVIVGAGVSVIGRRAQRRNGGPAPS